MQAEFESSSVLLATARDAGHVPEVRAPSREWHVTLYLYEWPDATAARAVLREEGGGLDGLGESHGLEGTQQRDGDRLAAARALRELADHLASVAEAGT